MTQPAPTDQTTASPMADTDRAMPQAAQSPPTDAAPSPTCATPTPEPAEILELRRRFPALGMCRR